ncbi:carbohydrate binding domain-containing protein [Arthrobacter sp. ISL-72]|uniref:carbohydrate binding domain-containing protein n=1 Tax=Arthrobacter sp. ISL-72 TaxID=2819114 RepID=UPI001BE6058B|nr:carbohydrate binding domain-containing protein [Arthrobacter sp. ISL-72]MBT2594024.1 carbohydrate binding domain-containing protein [Arthrobacter sp. ISL-72]
MKTITPTADQTSLIRNPGMGLGLYLEGFNGPLPSATDYWSAMDASGGSNKASYLYLRLAWDQVNPEEGRFLWRERDSNLAQIIQGAQQRGLKIAWRVIVQGGDYYDHSQATPQWVFDSGVGSWMRDAAKNPRVDDPIFQEKYTKLVDSLGEDFDDPATTMFVDGVGLGLWGENDHDNYLTETQRDQVYEWVTASYAKAFPRTLLGLQYGPNTFGTERQNRAINDRGYVIRRDSLGCKTYLSAGDKADINSHWPTTPVLGENCYHSFNTSAGWWQGDSYSSVREMMASTMSDAIELHSNTLDLRQVQDTEIWMKEAPDLVQYFIENGGYRLYPAKATIPTHLGPGGASVQVSWRNLGVGRLPNDVPQWNNKYQVAYALLDKATGQPLYTVLSDIDPGYILKGTDTSDQVTFAPAGVNAGRYDFAVAIVDRDNGFKPGVTLALNGATSGSWSVLGTTTVKASDAHPLDATISQVDESTVTMAFDGKPAVDRLGISGTRVSVDSWNGTRWVPILVGASPSTAGELQLGVSTTQLRVRGGNVAKTVTAFGTPGIGSAPAPAPTAPGTTIPTVTTSFDTLAGGSPVSAMLDGSDANTWESALNPSFPGTISVSWPKPKSINSLSIRNWYAREQAMTNITVDVREANGEWRNIVTDRALDWKYSDGTWEQQDVTFDEVVAAELRITVNAAATSWGKFVVSELVISAPGEHGPTGVLANGGFENPYLAPWTTTNARQTKAIFGEARTGQWHQLIWGETKLQQVVQVEPNTSYTLSGSAMALGDGQQVSFGVQESGAEPVAVAVVDRQWANKTVSFVTGPQTTAVTVFAATAGSSAGAIDSFELVTHAKSPADRPSPGKKP